MHEHTEDCIDVIYRCLECGLWFESGIADATREGDTRCPQCGLANAEPLPPSRAEEFVLRRGMKFR